MSLSQMGHFLLDIFQMTSIALVSVINHYHDNGLHLFWDTLYLSSTSFFFLIFTLWFARTAKYICRLVLFFLLIKNRSVLLARIEGPIFISKSLIILCVPFSLTSSGLCIYYLSTWPTFNPKHNSRRITFFYPVMSTLAFLFVPFCCIRFWCD